MGITHKKRPQIIHSRIRTKNTCRIIKCWKQNQKAYLLSDKRELEFDAKLACEGNSLIEVEIPKDYQDKEYYCICLETEEAEPVYEEIRG